MTDAEFEFIDDGQLNVGMIVHMVSTALQSIDARLVRHGERVAYILYHMLKQAGEAAAGINRDFLMMLGVLHDVGAYKTEEIDHMVQFETGDVWNHSIYGYVFLSRLANLGASALPVLFHHMRYEAMVSHGIEQAEYASLIALADRVDILLAKTADADALAKSLYSSPGQFAPRHIEWFLAAWRQTDLPQMLLQEKYIAWMDTWACALPMTTTQALHFLRMLIYAADFRSEHTVTHTINTKAISVELARRCGLPDETVQKIRLAALLHDLGKIAIPNEILENPGRLSGPEMAVMRRHVDYTEQFLTGLVSDEVLQIAIRHHEKLDGSGYSHGLAAAQLSLPQRIVAVADIVSALTSRRSYKTEYPKEKTLAIVGAMGAKGQLDAHLCAVVTQDFDSIMSVTDAQRDPVIQMYHQVNEEYHQLQQQYGGL